MTQKVCLIMAGGKGTRFWPQSTENYPKQYLNLVTEHSLLFDTLKRFEGLVNDQDRYIVTTQDQKALALKSTEASVEEKNIILEPAGMNTAPCIILSLVELLEKGFDPKSLVAIVPSDHVILNTKAYQSTMNKAFALAEQKQGIVTIGIRPTFPHTGFGYIKATEEKALDGFTVEEFKEKPDLETAKSYIAAGNYYWNAGMFVASIETLLNEFEKHAADLFKHRDALKNALSDEAKLKEVYCSLPAESIDYAIMEKSDSVYVVPSEFDWNDLGSWDALKTILDPVEDNYFATKNERFFVHEAKGNIVHSEGKMVALVGVNDLVIVENEKVLMVLPKERTQDVKKIVSYLKENPELKDLL